ncbi:MAG: opacity protein-like surface antigen [Verrucomicrobiales bacterium]|jgi:opacity protein-like surface antigen
MKIKSTILSATMLAAATVAQAGESSKATFSEPAPSDPFEAAIRTITSPTLFDLAVPRTQAHAFFMHQNMPDTLRTSLGDLPVGGDFQVYALQLEFALNERFSLVAAKDGYIDFNPDATLARAEGFANISAGFKYAFLYRPEDALAAAFNLQIEIPIGDTDVWQGEGDGAAIPSVSVVKLWNNFQFANNIGVRVPFSSSDSTTAHLNAHVSYALTDRFSPLVELNYFRVLKDGAGDSRFEKQAGGAVPAIATFEGGDLINLGSANAINKDLVTLGAGFRYRLTENIDLGAAYEIPLTEEEENLMESRITIDAVIHF